MQAVGTLHQHVPLLHLDFVDLHSHEQLVAHGAAQQVAIGRLRGFASGKYSQSHLFG